MEGWGGDDGLQTSKKYVCEHVCSVCTVLCNPHRYKEESSKKSPTGHPGVLQCSFKDSLPGKGDCALLQQLRLIVGTFGG